MLLPSAYLAPEANVASGRIVGALATPLHPTMHNRYQDLYVGHVLWTYGRSYVLKGSWKMAMESEEAEEWNPEAVYAYLTL